MDRIDCRLSGQVCDKKPPEEKETVAAQPRLAEKANRMSEKHHKISQTSSPETASGNLFCNALVCKRRAQRKGWKEKGIREANEKRNSRTDLKGNLGKTAFIKKNSPLILPF